MKQKTLAFFLNLLRDLLRESNLNLAAFHTIASLGSYKSKATHPITPHPTTKMCFPHHNADSRHLTITFDSILFESFTMTRKYLHTRIEYTCVPSSKTFGNLQIP